METTLFKQFVSGEPVEAHLSYGEPFTLTDYAKLIFNCNELPTDVEHIAGHRVKDPYPYINWVHSLLYDSYNLQQC